MPSDASKLRKQQQKASMAKKRQGAAETGPQEEDFIGTPLPDRNEGGGAPEEDLFDANHQKPEDRSATGVLLSHRLSRDIALQNFSITFHGQTLVTDTTLELNHGRRYGLLGPNGCGKSTLLNVLGCREVPLPDMIDVYHLHAEVPATDLTALEAVCAVDSEKARLEKEADELVGLDSDEAHERLSEIYERLDELEGDLAAKRAGEILNGLGFTKDMQNMKTREFSGGWRMRIALARALYVSPSLLLLDEPTNHLDLEACVWLEECLAKYNRILVIISHSQDFLNNVCTNIIHMNRSKLTYYSGNYDSYVTTRTEKEENQMKQYEREQDQISHMKEYIARFGGGSAKLARQAQSKEKTLDKMVRSGLTEKVEKDRTLSLRFIDCGKLPPPVLQFTNVDFGYPGKKLLLKGMDFGVDTDSRVAIVGQNGTGKSTLLKLMVGELQPLNGIVRKHSHLRIARYHQHFVDALNLSQSPLEYMMEQFPDLKEVESARRTVGRFGITGSAQLAPMRLLSDGQKSRVMFAWMCLRQPHLLLLDEPTNHLDMETIDALAQAINLWDGGMVLVSHDFRLISQVCKEVWVCEKQGIHRWDGDILSYKNMLRRAVGLAASRH